MEGLVFPFEGIAKGIVSIANTIIDVLDFINPFSENFILKAVIDFLGNIVSYINPFSEDFILKSIINFLSNLVSYINPFSDNFLGKKLIELFSNLFKDLFIPTENHFEELSNKINEKFGFISQIQELLSDLFNFSSSRSSTVPSWNITYAGVTVSIIDFTAFEQYRGVVHGIIICIMYLSFLLRLHRRLPGIIGAYGVK